MSDDFTRYSGEKGDAVYDLIQRDRREIEAKKKAARERANALRNARNQVMRDCGLVRGKDSMGRTIWE